MKPVLLPQTTAAWRRCKALIRVDAIPPAGIADYASVVRRAGESQPIAVFAALLSAFPTHFLDAEKQIVPDVWRLAFHHPALSLPRLLDPTFSPDQELTSAHYRDWLSDIPPSLLGTTKPTAHLVEELRQSMDACGVDRSKAVWAVLSTLRWVGVPRETLLRAHWWEVKWLRCFVKHAVDSEPVF